MSVGAISALGLIGHRTLVLDVPPAFDDVEMQSRTNRLLSRMAAVEVM